MTATPSYSGRTDHIIAVLCGISIICIGARLSLEPMRNRLTLHEAWLSFHAGPDTGCCGVDGPARRTVRPCRRSRHAIFPSNLDDAASRAEPGARTAVPSLSRGGPAPCLRPPSPETH